MDGELTLEQLSARTGEPIEHLRRWRELRLIGNPEAEALRPADVERTKLVQMLLRRGIGLEAIAEEGRKGALERYLERVFPDGPGPTYSLAEAAEIVGMDIELVRNAWTAIAGEGEPIRESDLEGLRLLKGFLDMGFPEEALLQGSRVYADGFAKIAEMEARLFHFYIHGRMRASGLAGDDLNAASDEAGRQAFEMIEPALLFFHRREWEQSQREDLVMHMAEAAGLMQMGDVPGQFEQAIVFVDLSSFTPMTEAMGDVTALRILERFSTLVRESARRWDGRVVKQIGDAFMLMFSHAPSAVACALEIEERTSREPQFPAARSGVHWGQVLYREGRYVGTNVNIASRVATEAGRHQVLVTSAVRRAAKGLDGVEFARLGKRRLKGLTNELVLYEAGTAGATAREQHIDPVCGMEMAPDEVAARLTLEGVEHCFCSDDCLRKYVAAPERYAK